MFSQVVEMHDLRCHFFRLFRVSVFALLAFAFMGCGPSQAGTAKRTVVVRVGDHDEALELLDIVWDWLFTHRSGLLQADGEGFYEGEELILPVK